AQDQPAQRKRRQLRPTDEDRRWRRRRERTVRELATLQRCGSREALLPRLEKRPAGPSRRASSFKLTSPSFPQTSCIRIEWHPCRPLGGRRGSTPRIDPIQPATSAPGDWWRTFFTGVSVDLWLQAVPEEVTRREVDFLVSVLGVSPPTRLLDVPCGGGRHSIA